jgi:hypothetical protein
MQGPLGKKQLNHLQNGREPGEKRIDASQRVERLQEKLKQLRQRDFTTFPAAPGAPRLGYRLNPCLPAEQLDALEQRYHLSLPEEYRLFLQAIGNGGTGPYYGVYPIERALQETFGDLLYDSPTNGPDYFQRPFVPPSSAKITEEQGTHSFFGLLRIAEMGCNGYCYLVVSGVERGTIWTDWEDIWLCPEHRRAPASRALIPSQVWNSLDGQHNAQFVDYVLSPAYPHRVTFFQWYEDWLNEQLRLTTPPRK